MDDFPQIRDSKPFSVQTIEGEQVLITAATAPQTNWQIIRIDSYRQISGQVRGVTVYGYIAGGVYLLFFVAFSILFYMKIIRPAVMLELQAMQYQITPHFIINTVNSIKIMAMISRQGDIEKMTEAFMRLLSAVLGKKGTESSAKEEIENIKHYIHIMKVRFGDKFNVEYDIAPEIEELSILSFLLQPIVENSIIHGFNEKDSGCLISIKGYCKDERLIFEVWDNGSGMAPEKARELLFQNHESGNGFLSMGVYNVNRRIKLNYGRGYGLRIESKPDESTCVIFELPMIIAKAGEKE
jgi:two-component system sensor histidine kinase YesM